MSYLALYRKFRPGTFSRLMGQDHVVRTLKNQLINNRIGHAYLFTGTRGTGKTSAAKIFAKAVNCLDPDGAEPCNQCENCRSINAGNFPDVVEVDAASNNGVDDIRRIIEEVRYTPVRGKYKVYIIDEAHMITGSAFNAFLKTLEEPPSYAVFILATTEPHKLPQTILSRVQRYDFKRIPTETITRNLDYIIRSEGVEADEKALRYIARTGDGSMRDSVSLLDKCIAFNLGERLTYENVLDTLGTVDTEVFSLLLQKIYYSDVPGALNVIDNATDEGKDLSQFLTDFIWYIRNVLMAGASDSVDMEMLGVSAENMAMIRKDAGIIQTDALIRYIRVLSETIDRIRYSSGKQILVEVCMIKLAKPQMETDTSSLADRIRQLEGRISGMQQMVPAGAPAFAPPEYMDLYGPQGPDYDMALETAAVTRMTNPDAFAGLVDDIPAAGAAGQVQGISTGIAADIHGAVSEGNTDRVQTGHGRDTDTAGAADGTAGKDMDPEMIRQKIISACDSHIIRSSLNKCGFHMSADTNVLEILAPNDFICRQLRDEQNMNALNSVTAKCFGTEFTVRVNTSASQDGQLSFFTDDAHSVTNSIDSEYTEELLKRINFNIGTEDQ